MARLGMEEVYGSVARWLHVDLNGGAEQCTPVGTEPRLAFLSVIGNFLGSELLAGEFPQRWPF